MAKIVLRSYEEENARRKKFRYVLLFLLLPLLAIVLVYDGKITSMFITAGSAITEYNNQQYQAAKETSDKLKNLNLIQSWLAYYNSGTSRVELGEYDEAIIDLTTALGLIGQRDEVCAIRTNLSIAYERYGDQKASEGITEVAQGFYELGWQTINDAPQFCFPPNSNPENGGEEEQDQPGQEMQDRQERLEEKIGSNSPGNNQTEEGDQGQESDQLSPEEQVRDNTEQTGRDRNNKENAGGAGGGGNSPPSDKPW